MPGGFFPRHLVLDRPSPELSFHPSKIKQKLGSVMASIEGGFGDARLEVSWGRRNEFASVHNRDSTNIC